MSGRQSRRSRAPCLPPGVLCCCGRKCGPACCCWRRWRWAASMRGSGTGRFVARHPQYQLTADRIHITPQPPWIRSDVKAEVLRDASLIGTVSVLDDPDALVRRIQDAFEFHPWVAQVLGIRKRLPASLDIELEYRRPVAAVETSDGRNLTLTPIDVDGVRLPEADFTELDASYLPRIIGTYQPTADRRVVGRPAHPRRGPPGRRTGRRLAATSPGANRALHPTPPHGRRAIVLATRFSPAAARTSSGAQHPAKNRRRRIALRHQTPAAGRLCLRARPAGFDRRAGPTRRA